MPVGMVRLTVVQRLHAVAVGLAESVDDEFHVDWDGLEATKMRESVFTDGKNT
jgi:hypothetical protein